MGYLDAIVHSGNYKDVKTCLTDLPFEPLRRLEDRKLAARIVDGINCTPYDIAHERGYLDAIVHPGNYKDVKTCLTDVDFEPLRRLEDRKLAARIVDGINCTPYDIAHERGYLD